jgi:glycosyltransferase involved in cell wall biosynthesis
MIVFINGTQRQCGVYQYGLRLFQQLGRPDLFEYVEIGSQADYDALIQTKTYSARILNYHPELFRWWRPEPNTYYIHHECDYPFDPAFMLNSDPTHPLGIPRPLYQGAIVPLPSTSPTFGSFGFGFENKGFERLVSMVQHQYDVATIKLLLPYAHYGDTDGSRSRSVVDNCRKLITKRGIRLLVMHNFLPDIELVSFLASNDMNIFLYDQMYSRGCSSAIDHALAAGRPIAISDSDMFRHIYSDAICAYKRSLRDILADGPKHILPFLEKWNPTTLRETVLNRIQPQM